MVRFSGGFPTSRALRRLRTESVGLAAVTDEIRTHTNLLIVDTKILGKSLETGSSVERCSSHHPTVMAGVGVHQQHRVSPVLMVEPNETPWTRSSP